MYRESNLRSISKTTSHRITNSITTIILVFLFTGEINAAIQVGLAEIIVKFSLFYLHERIWDRIHFGKERYTPFVLWLTGLPCSGKKEIADNLYRFLKKRNIPVERLDGDDVKTLLPSTGFTRDQRTVYLKRMGYLASLLERNGVTVIASFISPFNEVRQYNRSLCINYIEVYVSTPQEACRKRDIWGLYNKAENNEIQHFVGIHEKYDVPQNAEIEFDLSKEHIIHVIKGLVKYLKRRFSYL